jgi:hypothetical protein
MRRDDIYKHVFYLVWRGHFPVAHQVFAELVMVALLLAGGAAKRQSVVLIEKGVQEDKNTVSSLFNELRFE